MWRKFAVAICVCGLIAIFALLLSRKAPTPATTEAKTNEVVAPKAPPQASAANAETVEQLHSILNDYHSTNLEANVTSSIARQLIAERLRTNSTFLEWGTNVVRATISRFIKNGRVPIYDTAGFSEDGLQIREVTVHAPSGFYGSALYDPKPSSQGPLEFIVEGGTAPIVTFVQNRYRTEAYQLQPGTWDSYPRRIGRMNWEGAKDPLDKTQVEALAASAFLEMTGTSLEAMSITGRTIETPRVHNPDVPHPDVSLSGNPNAKFISFNDDCYPFAEFAFSNTNSGFRTLKGEMVQTSPGHGEFVQLIVIVPNLEAVFDLGQQFLGKGTWEQSLLTEVRSMDTNQRGTVYRRLFAY